MPLFPTTVWQLLGDVGSSDEAARRAAFGELFTRYRVPILSFLHLRGVPVDRGEDLVQDFFLDAIASGFFAKADRERGRFRDLLRTAVKFYAAKKYRAEHARVRHPAEGFVPDLAALPEAALGTSDEDAERIFERQWAETVVRRALAVVAAQFATRTAHWRIFEALIIAPALEGATPPAHRELAAELGLAEKDVSNRLGTVRAAYREALKAEVGTYAAADEVDEEIRRLFGVLAKR
jgi:DNA-directed RNA polymerase specialized sigma24 family protein